jgi:CRP-like cAMP-binding protein
VPEWSEAPAIQLSQLAPFADLDPAVLGALEVASTIVELEPGEILFRQGDPGDALYVIVTGRVQVLIEQANGPSPITDVSGPPARLRLAMASSSCARASGSRATPNGPTMCVGEKK